MVRGIFGGKVGTKSITSTALQAEASSDYAEAVKLYNEVARSLSTTSQGRGVSWYRKLCISSCPDRL